MFRTLFWLTLLIDLAGLGMSLAIIIKSFEPKQGASMILMGLPCIAIPTAGVAVFLIGFNHAHDGRLKRWERILANIAIAISLLLAIPLVLLG